MWRFVIFRALFAPFACSLSRIARYAPLLTNKMDKNSAEI